MFISTRGSDPVSGTTAMVLVAVFLLGLATGGLIGRSPPSRDAVAGTSPPPPADPMPASDPQEVRPHYPARVVRIVDGDTFDASVNVWPGIDIATRVRLRGIDAPEMRTQCRDEHVRAQAARDALARMLSGGAVGIFAVTPDKYGGRILAGASTRGTADVADALLQAGVVRPYAGGRRERWC